MSANQPAPHPLLRHRDGHHARVTFEELLFDLVYVFAVTQLSHGLLHHLTLVGVMENLILWFAVWLGWQYTCWVTNWFNPETPRIRGLIFALMFPALLMAASIPEAFGERGLVFALAYMAIQVGRTVFIVLHLPAEHALAPNFKRMLGWVVIAATFWLVGAFMEGPWRIGLWLIAVLCEYVSPMFGFALPGLGRSSTIDWTIEGAHLAERCQLFVIVALGETLLASGAVLAETEHWDIPVLAGLWVTLLGTLAMWWLYFGTASKDATHCVTHSKDPGRTGANFHYIHAVLVAGIIATAVGNDLVMAHPDKHMNTTYVVTLLLGPMIFLFASLLYKREVYQVVAKSHLAGIVLLLALAPIAFLTDLLMVGTLTTVVLLIVSFVEWRVVRRLRAKQANAVIEN
ncbi:MULTISPECIES: low temperature requirement protein A [unclassified Pseudomonas]|uniref:low temperature requirement protein A n=1 Tax=unclassified Pseudomonas TaxID=196821 RepID=UPI0008715F5F|nr:MULTISPECIES: low temperature requirement protein A [unclassified Pseudomonas]SCW99541.1 Low temperature requirement protein LtrA [Pseudomonas sp. NFACC56-3]SFL06769.1 Low temperature requirement protein LtrA [Pseudomonas sp. NFACC52]